MDMMKSKCLRLAKNINKELQRSKMNPLLKPLFTESSIKFINDGKVCGVLLNASSINNEDALNVLTEERFKNNMNLISETVKKHIKRQKLEDCIQLNEYSLYGDMFEYDNKLNNKFTNCLLIINEDSVLLESKSAAKIDDEAEDKNDDMDLVGGVMDSNWNNTYNIEPKAEGPATRYSLHQELLNSANKVHPFIIDNINRNTKYAKDNDIDRTTNFENDDIFPNLTTNYSGSQDVSNKTSKYYDM